jgi:hypothetical protein
MILLERECSRERDYSHLAAELEAQLESRVARCFIFKPKIPIWVNFGVP